ncbi:hypothetical protein FOZ63_015728, partial [Perkinsus olseni]
MTRVVLLVGVPPGTASLGYTNKSDVDLVIAFGPVKAFSDGDLSRTLLQMTGPKPTHVPICLGITQLVFFNDARREPGGNKFTHLGCAIWLTKNTYINVATPAPVIQAEANAEEVGRKYVTPVAFSKYGRAKDGTVVVHGRWDDERANAGVVAMNFNNAGNFAFTRFPRVRIHRLVDDLSSTRLKGPFGERPWCYGVDKRGLTRDATPDLATAEGIMNVYPLRLDNIRLCIEGSHWTLHLGEDTDDGVGKKVVITLTD